MSVPAGSARILILGEARVIHAQRWAAYFRQQGWTVRWLSFPPIPTGVHAEGLGSTALPRALAILRVIPRLRRIIGEFSPDITSALFLPDYGWLGALSGFHPLVVSAWGSDVLIAPEKSPLHRARIRSVIRRADHLFTDADVLSRRLQDLGASAADITVVPLGVSDEWLAAGESRPASVPPVLTVIQTRRLEPLYCVETFLVAAARLEATSPGRFRFVIVGDGSQRERLGRLAAQWKLDTRNLFLPMLPEEALRQQVGAADLYVSTAASDGTSVSLLEAMAAGCFPIVTDLAANREWIEPGVNGLLFPVGDDRALAQMIERAAADPVLRQQAQVHNRSLITERARWNDNMAVVEKAMRSTIERFQKR
ncbi:MAG: glycosyltransferase family 4 protein [Candidatus Zixiibacteriota bacterium]